MGGNVRFKGFKLLLRDLLLLSIDDVLLKVIEGAGVQDDALVHMGKSLPAMLSDVGPDLFYFVIGQVEQLNDVVLKDLILEYFLPGERTKRFKLSTDSVVVSLSLEFDG